MNRVTMQHASRLPKYVARRLASRADARVPQSRWAQAVLAYQREGDDVLDRVRGCRVRYDPTTFLGQCLFREGGFEDAEIDFFAQRLRALEAPVVLDVGANIGWHAARWATRVPRARIHAFEPSERARRYLDANLQANGVGERVTVVSQALSDQPGRGAFYECRDPAYSSLQDTQRNPVAAQHEVDVGTLDEYCARVAVSQVSLVKIDVEGLEFQVLRGAERTLRRWRPDLFVEIDQRNLGAVRAEEVIDWIRALGYRAQVFQFGRLVPAGAYQFWFYNYCFTAEA